MPSIHHVRRALFAVITATVIAAPIAPAAAKQHRSAVPCVAGVTCPAKPKCAGANVEPAAGNFAVIRRATLCLLNKERTKRGLSKLRANNALRGVAQRYARKMVADSFFDHISPTGSTFVQRIQQSTYLDGAKGWSLGENLAWGGGTLATPRKIVSAWMHSAGHRHNILTRSFRDIGVGIVLGLPIAGGGTGATYVNEFGERS
jgi:uncharacterized protein YkwD